jgi:hypothetical protein
MNPADSEPDPECPRCGPVCDCPRDVDAETEPPCRELRPDEIRAHLNAVFAMILAQIDDRQKAGPE